MKDEKDAYIEARDKCTSELGYVDPGVMWKAGVDYAKQNPMHVNVNEVIKVKLTPEGLAALETDHAMLNMRLPIQCRTQYVRPLADAEGYTHWTLWALMQCLGHHICVGGPMMFETTIIRVPTV